MGSNNMHELKELAKEWFKNNTLYVGVLLVSSVYIVVDADQEKKKLIGLNNEHLWSRNPRCLQFKP